MTDMVTDAPAMVTVSQTMVALYPLTEKRHESLSVFTSNNVMCLDAGLAWPLLIKTMSVVSFLKMSFKQEASYFEKMQ